MLMFTVIFFVALLIFLTWLDFSMGKQADTRTSLKRTYPVRYSDMDFFDNGHDFFARYFDELRKAQSSIFVSFYITKQDKFSQQFFTILMEKAAAGVEVKLLVDWIGGKALTKSFQQDLRASGVELVFSHRLTFPYTFYSLQRRNHRKITVIDGEHGFLGGFNIGKEYIGRLPKLAPWRDYHLLIRGDGLQDLYAEFAIDWERATGHSLPPFHGTHHKGNIPHQFFPSEAGQLERKFIDILSSAEKSIQIGSPYFVPTDRIMDILMKQAAKGIQIDILVPDIADHKLVKEAAYRYFRLLYASGPNVHVYQYRKGFYHAKVCILDGVIADIGTANFDRRSFTLNHELNCFIYDEQMVKKVATTFAYDIGNGTYLSAEELAHMPVFTRLKERVARVIENLL